MALTTFGIVLLPDDATERRVKELAAKQPGNEICPNLLVHLSLLHVVLKRSQLSEIRRILDGIQFPGMIPLQCHELLWQNNGWSFLEVRRSRMLLQLQKAILPIAELRSGNTNFTWRASATIGQKRAFTKYGYPNIATSWSPHFTFRVTKGKQESVRLPFDQSGRVRAIALGTVGDYGTITKLLHIRELPNEAA